MAEKRRIKELESRLHPKTAKDFEVLYSGLESRGRGRWTRLLSPGPLNNLVRGEEQ